VGERGELPRRTVVFETDSADSFDVLAQVLGQSWA
jgi:hypothetical protein